jgi:glutamine amidotransferase
MTAGSRGVRATFWLLEAPDSLAEQSRRHPDGYGIATFGEQGSPKVQKRPAAAYRDEQFARAAREEESSTFVAHVRYASTGNLAPRNTHPFEQRGRVLAHNGHLEGLDVLEERLGPEGRGLVQGDTDSERLFALITTELERGGDPEAAIRAALEWVARELPVYSINLVLATASDLWALRYPEANPLLVLERAPGGPSGGRHLDAASAAGRIRVRSGDLAERAVVVFASEPMDEDPGWRSLEPGELVRVDENLNVSSVLALTEPPAHQLGLEDLDVGVAASQRQSRAAPGDAEKALNPASGALPPS